MQPSTYNGTASNPGTKLNILPDFVGRTFIGLSEVILTVQFFFLSSALVGDSSENFSPDSDMRGKNILADLQSSDSDEYFNTAESAEISYTARHLASPDGGVFWSASRRTDTASKTEAPPDSRCERLALRSLTFLYFTPPHSSYARGASGIVSSPLSDCIFGFSITAYSVIPAVNIGPAFSCQSIDRAPPVACPFRKS